MTKTIKRPSLRYYGGKWRLAPWIIESINESFPRHGIYTEPFFGAGSVLLRKERVRVESVNDIDNGVINFFRVIREKPVELIDAIRFTPWSLEEGIAILIDDDPSDIELARRFYANSWMTIAQTLKHPSFRISKCIKARPADILRQIDYLYEIADRMIGVQIENSDALDFIRKYDSKDTVFYCDPPYMINTRSHPNQYNHEVSDEFHLELFELAQSSSGMFAVSGYQCDMYKNTYDKYGWKRLDRKSLANGHVSKTESLWIKPN